jgi:membrane protease YdiL (CAAX protease family)
MKSIFLNLSQRRLRAGWRIPAYFLIFFTSAALANFALKKLIPALVARSLAGFVVVSAIALGTLWLAGRVLDRRKFRDYGFHLSRRWWLDLVFGFLAGGVLISLIFLFEKGMGWVAVVGHFQNLKNGYQGLPFAVPLVMGLTAFVIVGFYEECLFRANLITNLAEGFNRTNSMAKKALIGGYILSSLLFGAAHSINPNASLTGVANIMLGGLFLGLPYVLTGELAISWGLHISWNFFQGYVFGFPTSGVPQDIAVLAIAQRGPRLWTGGTFGPEGGLVGTFAVLIGCALILLWLRMSKRPIALSSRLAVYRFPDLKGFPDAAAGHSKDERTEE